MICLIKVLVRPLLSIWVCDWVGAGEKYRERHSMFTCTGTYMWMCVHMEARGLPNWSPPSILRQGPSFEPRAHDMVSLASELVPRMAFLNLLSNGCKVGRRTCPASLSMLGIQTPILTLVQQALYQPSCSQLRVPPLACALFPKPFLSLPCFFLCLSFSRKNLYKCGVLTSFLCWGSFSELSLAPCYSCYQLSLFLTTRTSLPHLTTLSCWTIPMMSSVSLPDLLDPLTLFSWAQSFSNDFLPHHIFKPLQCCPPTLQNAHHYFVKIDSAQM